MIKLLKLIMEKNREAAEKRDRTAYFTQHLRGTLWVDEQIRKGVSLDKLEERVRGVTDGFGDAVRQMIKSERSIQQSIARRASNDPLDKITYGRALIGQAMRSRGES